MTAATVVVPEVALLDAMRVDGGFTWDPTSGVLVRPGDRVGWAIAREHTERIIGATLDAAAFEATLRVLLVDYRDSIDAGALVGGWFSPEREVWMVELTDVVNVDQGQAVLIGALRGQESVFNLHTGESVTVPAYLGQDEPLQVVT